MTIVQLALALAGATSMALTGAPSQPIPDSVTHTMNFGETLSGLAQLTDASELRLAQMNYLTRGDTLLPDEQVQLPQHPPGTFTLYHVARGDTLLKIAARYGVSPYELQQINRLACPGCLVVGQALRIPAPTPRSTQLETVDALPQPLAAVRLSSASPLQGDVLIVRVQTARPSQVEGQLDDQAIHFFTDEAKGDGWYVGMLGVDAMLAPGAHRLEITAIAGDGLAGTTQGTITVRPGDYVLENVILAQTLQPLLDPELNLNEEREMKALYDTVGPIKWWDRPFNFPVVGKLISAYGNPRVYNGISLGTYHTGYDIAAPIGTSVEAGAPGRVIAVRRLAVRGLVVVIDHGHGVLTGYFHLSQARVREGELVDQGDVIGAVGTTGRSQGLHVHFDLAVGGVTVDPGYWTKVALP